MKNAHTPKDVSALEPRRKFYSIGVDVILCLAGLVAGHLIFRFWLKGVI